MRILLMLALASLLVVVAPKGWRAANGAYQGWKRDRALAQAERFFAEKDYNKALLAMQVAIRADWENPEVWRKVADLSEAAGAREAVMQRQHVAMLSRGALDDQLALALTALRFGDMLTAADAMRAVPEIQRESAKYRRVAAFFALQEGAKGVADHLLGTLLSTDKSEGVRFTQASLRMSSPTPAVAVAARLELAGLAQNPKYATAALRELLGDAILRADWVAVKGWGERLAASPDVAFRDRIALATLKILQDKMPLESVLPELKREAAATPGGVADLCGWLVSQGKTSLAIEWVDGLEPALKAAPEAKAMRLDLALSVGDWAGAGELLYQGAAGPIEAPVVRLAMEALATAEMEGAEARFARWNQVIDAARGDITAYRLLYRLTTATKWEAEAEVTLLAVAQAFPGQTWAHEGLARVYHARRDAAGLRRILGIWHQQWPNVARIRNDWAVMDMLVDPVSTWNRAKAAAEDLYKNDPQNAFYATTCALAYAQAGRTAEALAVVEKLKPAARRLSSRAPYLAYVYAEAGRMNEAKAQLLLIRPSEIIKEEQRLADVARVRVEAFEKQQAEIRRLTGADGARTKP